MVRIGAQAFGACQRRCHHAASPLKLARVPQGPVQPSPLVEGIFRREILPWGLLGLTLGLVEGATAAILVKQHFAAAAAFGINIAVALVSGAPAFSNVLSFVWANLAHGRARVQLMVALQAGFALLVGCVALASQSWSGLWVTVAAVIAARVLWAGILTVRAAIWTANYPRNVLARITGRIVIVNALTVATSAALVGWALEARFLDARWLYGGGALAGLAGAWLYRAMRVRREFQLLAAEASHGARGEPFSLAMVTRILREDPAYREYMLWMGVFGAGSLMLTAQLVLIFADELHLTSALQIGLLATVVFTLGVFTRSAALLWAGAVLLGAAQAGANLGWNLGHNDFASLGRAQHYMGVHVTLTGLRGGLAPPLGVLAYMALEHWHAGFGQYALVLPVALTALGALGFNRMRAAQERTQHRTQGPQR